MFDVIVIGGGINGTAVARDCALRGLRVALFEKHDFGFGASGNNSGMIHGGPRYLLTHPHVTRESCQDSGYIQQIAKHLVFRIPFLMPLDRRRRAASMQLAAFDAFFEFYDRFQPLKRGKPHTRLTAAELAQIYPGLRGDFVGAVSFDEWGIDGNRLCVLNAIDAAERGGSIYHRHEVTGLLCEQDANAHDTRVAGVVYVNSATGERGEARAAVVINATGAWTDWVQRSMQGAEIERPLVRPGKGIHVHYDRRFSNYGLVTEAIDGRQIFLMPWQNLSWIATTDDDYYGDADDVRATSDEVRYLVQGIAQVFPAVRRGRITGTSAGLRPTMWAYGLPEDALSREHAIVDHGERDGRHRLYSMVGGKLASYRMFAQQMTDEVVRILGRGGACTSHTTALPGSDEPKPETSDEQVEAAKMVAQVALERMRYRHGSRTAVVLNRIAARPSEASLVCHAEPVTEAEVRHACQHEWVATLDDLARRTRLGLGACLGCDCVARAARIVGEERGWTAAEVERQAQAFLEARVRPCVG